MVAIFSCNTEVYKIFEALFSAFFFILLIIACSFYSCVDLFASLCLVLKLVYNGNYLSIKMLNRVVSKIFYTACQHCCQNQIQSCMTCQTEYFPNENAHIYQNPV
jgi:hypothetical protein